MRKISKKVRQRDVNRTLAFPALCKKRKRRRKRKNGSRSKDGDILSLWRRLKDWIDKLSADNKIDISFIRKNKIELTLPEVLNFSDMYESTALHINVIRKLTNIVSSKAYSLVKVNFDNLKKCSTSASLVLTAELSKWDDAIRSELTPVIENWDSKVLKQFYELGFFELFKNSPNIDIDSSENALSLVKFKKSNEHDIDRAVELRHAIQELIGDKIDKWPFLYVGLSEAITNVVQHAYPISSRALAKDKNWYLTASFNRDNNLLKVAFYDQGVGIPKALPSSSKWKNILGFLSKFPTL